MFRRRIGYCILYAFILAHNVPAAVVEPSLSTQLGWIADSKAPNLCQGFYQETIIPYTPNPKITSQEDNYNINADETTYALKGISTLKGHVRVTQPERELTSEIAHIYPDKKTGRMKTIETIGNVHLRTPGKLLIAKKANMDLQTKLISLQELIYRLSMDRTDMLTLKNPKTGKVEHRLYQLNAWGSAASAKQIRRGVTDLKSATYTTCPPTGTVCWHVKASSIRLNSNTGRGYAVNARLYAKKIPFFYVPYLNFPINKKRQSGFLYPSYGNKRSDGITLVTPYYWNIAPNYDATITPQFMSKRGVLTSGLFRYLVPNSSGQIESAFIPNDNGFIHFKNEAKTKWADQPTYHRLQDSHNSRGTLHWQDNTTLNEYWTANINYNYVSDDYYLQDFGRNLIDNSNNQLLRQATLNYLNDSWNFSANVQSYQTLHPVNQSNVSNQYARLPQLQLGGYFPDQRYGLDYTIQSEYVYFNMRRNPYSTDDTDPITGSRFNMRPAATLPIRWPFAYLRPRVQLQMTQYDLRHTAGFQPSSPGEAIPIFDTKAGLYFDRNMKWLQHSYQQTLEPEIYYLYVPYHNQNHLPLFDTTLQTFNYDLMFEDNRFSGVDRIGDTNQITYGLTTRFIDADTGGQKATASIGQIRYLHQRRVTLYSGNNYINSTTNRQAASPVAGTITYSLNPRWNARGDLTWNPHTHQFDNKSASIQYKPNSIHILNLSYQYVRGGDVLIGAPADSPKNDLKQTDLTGYWKLNNRWNLMGRWNYNWSHQHAQAYFYGLAYDSCCWSIRFLGARTFIGLAPDNRAQYDSGIYLQVALKGLGTMGNDSPTSLMDSIPGYIDNFGLER